MKKVILIFIFPFLLNFSFADTIAVVNVSINNQIHFGDPSAFDTDEIEVEQSGRVISRTLNLPEFDTQVKITACLDIQSTINNQSAGGDCWDRAGNVYLPSGNMENI